MTAFVLRLIALVSMLLDHLYHTVLPDQLWLHCVGRLAFPIFAFQLVTGYCHTHDKRRYALRLALFALLSEIPFDLMAYGTPFYPDHQNVLWTLLLGFFMIHLKAKVQNAQFAPGDRLLAFFVIVTLFTLSGFGFYLDYGGFGILQIFVFYMLRKKHWALQALCVLPINMLMGGSAISIAGLELPIQGLAVLSMLPIGLYNGRKGPGGKFWSRFCYIFYPAHLLILALFRLI